LQRLSQRFRRAFEIAAFAQFGGAVERVGGGRSGPGGRTTMARKKHQVTMASQHVRSCKMGHKALVISSILRKEILQIGSREVAGEALFAQNVGDGLGLALLQFPDFFLHRPRRDQPIGVDRQGLADAVGAVDGLRFDGRVPPGIVEDDVAGGGQVEARAGARKLSRKTPPRVSS
jgi:hypothetical protein